MIVPLQPAVLAVYIGDTQSALALWQVCIHRYPARQYCGQRISESCDGLAGAAGSLDARLYTLSLTGTSS